MGLILRNNTIIKNLRVGPLSGGGGNGGGGGGSSEPSYLAVGAQSAGSGATYVYDASNYSTSPTKLTAPQSYGSDNFGIGTSIYGNVLYVGATGNTSQGDQAGYVSVYDITNLSSSPTILAPSDLSSYDRFGKSIASTANYLAVGAYSSNSGAGAVYVYDASNLSASPTKLTPTELDGGDNFGWSVAINSNYIIVGSRSDDDIAESAGAVYVYNASNLSSSPTKLTLSGLSSYDELGRSVAASDTQIVVGSPYDDDQGNNAGAVYVYDATNLSATPTKLAPSTIGNVSIFGFSVAVSNEYIVVGAFNDGGTGSAYVYDATNLSATPTKLAPSELDSGDYFGESVSIFGNQIVVSSPSDDDQGSGAGAAYVYDATNLSATPTKLTASDGSAGDGLGSSVSLG